MAALKVATTKNASHLKTGDIIFTNDGWAEVRSVDTQGGYGQRAPIKVQVLHGRDRGAETIVELWAETPVVMECDQETVAVRTEQRKPGRTRTR